MFAHFYGIMPWDMYRLTALDFDKLVEAYERHVKDSERG